MTFMAYDILYLSGRMLIGEPIEERRRIAGDVYAVWACSLRPSGVPKRRAGSKMLSRRLGIVEMKAC